MQRSLNSSKASKGIRPDTSWRINLWDTTRCKSLLSKAQLIPLEVKEADDTS
jgi:hypothetical protein